MHPSQFQTGPVAGCPARPGLIALLDPLLRDSRLTGTFLVGVVLRRGRLRRVVRAFEAPTDATPLDRVPLCWRATGLLVDVSTRRSDEEHPRQGRLVHLVDRHGDALTRLIVEGGHPRTATSGHGPVDEICRILLGLNRPTAETDRP